MVLSIFKNSTKLRSWRQIVFRVCKAKGKRSDVELFSSRHLSIRSKTIFKPPNSLKSLAFPVPVSKSSPSCCKADFFVKISYAGEIMMMSKRSLTETCSTLLLIFLTVLKFKWIFFCENAVLQSSLRSEKRKKKFVKLHVPNPFSIYFLELIFSVKLNTYLFGGLFQILEV